MPVSPGAADPDFTQAFTNSLVIAVGMTAIAVPLGSILAFLMARTDLPGRSWIEPLLLVPVFVSPMVLGLGYVVAAGPVGFYSVWFQGVFGGVPHSGPQQKIFTFLQEP